MRYKLLSVPLAFFLALFLLFCGAENGLASRNVYGMTLTYRPKISSGYSEGYKLYYYFLSGQSHTPSAYEAWPFLQDLQSRYSSVNGLYSWFPYGYLEPGYGNDPPYIYQHFITYFTAGNVPDDWTQDDVDDLLNEPFNSLTPSQKAATTGSFVAGVQNGSKFAIFNKRTLGTYINGGVVTYDSNGDIAVAYPDNTGYISGNKLQPDGSTTPVYYTIDNNSVIEHDTLPVTDFSSLSYDSDLNHYTLDIPNYSKQLDAIINKIDGIKFDGTINPEITLNPTVTVPPPEVTVNVPETDLTDIESSLVEIGNTLVADDYNLNLQTNDLQLTSEEQLDLNALRSWQVDIPLLGDAVDFGLNSLIGKIPNVGTEYVWLDYTIGGSKRASKAPSSNPLNGYHIRIDLTSYQQTLLAVRGWLILLEALFFSLLVYKNVREALKV